MGNFYVGDQFRTNNKSLVPGGYDIKVYYKNGSSMVYSRIKNPEKYLERVYSSDNVERHEILGPSNG